MLKKALKILKAGFAFGVTYFALGYVGNAITACIATAIGGTLGLVLGVLISTTIMLPVTIVVGRKLGRVIWNIYDEAPMFHNVFIAA